MAPRLSPTFVVIAILLISSLITSSHADDDEKLLAELEKRAAAFPVERYDSDPILLQKVDTVNEKSTYMDPQSDQEFYQREKSDKNKEAVALTSEEDKISTTGDKRVYVVMRMSNIDGKPKKYFPSLAYLVDPVGRDTSEVVESKGKKYGLEWSVWNDGVLSGFTYSFQFSICKYSVIIPCKVEAKEGGGGGSSDKKNETEKKVETKANSTAFPANDYANFFLDLDSNKMSGRFQVIGMAFDFLNKAVDGVGSLWCGVSGMLLGQCHQYDPVDGYTKSQIGTSVVRSDGKVMAAGASNSFGSDGLLGTLTNAITFNKNKDVPMALMNQVPEGVQMAASNVQFVPPAQWTLGRKKRDAEGERTKGWRTQFIKKIEPNALTGHDSDIFYGLGNCPPAIRTTAQQFETATTEDDVVTFYVNFLRNGCTPRVKMVLPALKAEGVVEITGKGIGLKTSHALFTTPKITWVEEQKLASALEFYVVSETYKEMKGTPEKEPKSHIDKKISNSIKFIEKFTLNFITAAKTKGTKHFIRMLRHLAQILRATLEKLGEDTRNLEECSGDCAPDNELNNNDKVTTMGLIKYIMHGMPHKDPIATNWKEFMTKNQASIEAALLESHM